MTAGCGVRPDPRHPRPRDPAAPGVPGRGRPPAGSPREDVSEEVTEEDLGPDRLEQGPRRPMRRAVYKAGGRARVT